MKSIADQYEDWIGTGDLDLAAFVEYRKKNNEPLSDDQFRDCVLTDQYLRHQRERVVDVVDYVKQFDVIASDEQFQVELWIEAWGYLEDAAPQTAESREAFLAGIPDSIQAVVADEVATFRTSRGDSDADAVKSPIGLQIAVEPVDSGLPKIPRYRIVKQIGKGAFGTVYRGWDTQLQRVVAVKVLQTNQPAEDLFAEARLVASLETQGIVSVYDCGIEEGGRAYFVSSYIDGISLSDWLSSAEGGDHEKICRLFFRLCKSLDRAHQAGVVHRDIKPTNIMVNQDGDPVLLDFGLATRDWKPGGKGELIGTPAYMSPEQARGEGHLVDARSDVFSIGILLLEALTGKLPWDSTSAREMIREIAHGRVRSARLIDERIPIELDRICSKATATAMSARYSTAADLASDLQWFIDESAATDSKKSAKAGLQAIGPQGLQPYTRADAEWFWQLIPGQRNAKGEPDNVRWWLDRLQDTSGVKRNVLVLYGPSGSGKSSLLTAGVIPFVDSNRHRCVEVDASEFNAAPSISQQLAAWMPELNNEEGALPRKMAGLRERNRSRGDEFRHIIVFDQFEQIFKAGFEEHREELFRAMRQADGQRLQFVLVVRDEFWSAISQWMRRLDSPLRDGRNAMALERFSRLHAADVLRVWASALGRKVDDTFIAKAVDSVADGNRVVPVRLALLAKILGKDGWTDQRLEEITSHHSLSGFYLDSVLGELAPSAQRRLVQPAKEVLRCLTPASGQIRGPSKSKEQLRAACRAVGQSISAGEFDDLLDLLDRQLHLVTLVENENVAVLESSKEGALYQLPHDFLVPELRRWLESQDRQSITGRATLDLKSAALRWEDDRRSSNLAGPIECLRFSLFASGFRNGESAEQNDVEQTFLKTSARKHLLTGLVFAVAAVCLFGLFHTMLQRSRGIEIVQRLLTSKFDDLPAAVSEVRQNQYWTQGPLEDAIAIADDGEAGDLQRDRIALARLASDASEATYLADRLVKMIPQANRVFAAQMRSDLSVDDRVAVADQLSSIASDETYTGRQRLKAAIAIGAIDREHPFWAQSGDQISRLLVDSNPTELGWLAEGLYPIRRRLVSALANRRDRLDATRTRTATYLLAEFTADDPNAQVELVKDTAIVHLPAVFSTLIEVDSTELDSLLKAEFDAAVVRWNASKEGSETDSIIDARVAGRLGAALILRGHSDAVIEHLRFRDDPTLRSYLILCYAEGNGPALPLAELLVDEELPEEIAAAVLQMVGSLPASSKVPSSIRKLANRMYRSSIHRELNATAEWFLRRHGYAADLQDAEVPETIGYQTAEGQTMIRLPGGFVATVGGSNGDSSRIPNEEPHEVDIPTNLFFSRGELTMKQLEGFVDDMEQNREGEPESRRRRLMKMHGPEVRISFFLAAAYCNWLSKKEGIPKEQWCYFPNEDGEYGPGMEIASDHLTRSGYQLPTPDLWEYACRGGTTTSRPYGVGTELSHRYVRWFGTRTSEAKKSAARLPNGFGLFDMLGNGAEWSVGLVDTQMMGGPRQLHHFDIHDRRPFVELDDRPKGPPLVQQRGDRRAIQSEGRFTGPPPPRGPENRRPGLAFGGGPEIIDAAGKVIGRNNRFVILGGAYDSSAQKIRSSDRSIVSPTSTNKPVTVRLMRIVPK